MENILSGIEFVLAIIGGLFTAGFLIFLLGERGRKNKEKKIERARGEMMKKLKEIEAIHDEIDSNFGVRRVKEKVKEALEKAHKADRRCDNIDDMINAILKHVSITEAYLAERLVDMEIRLEKEEKATRARETENMKFDTPTEKPAEAK